MLPGGLSQGETRHRRYAFQPLTGDLELAIAEDGVDVGSGSLPHRVSRILAKALARIGDLPVTVERAEELSVADRQFLMRRLAAHLGRDELWLSSRCTSCEERFDLFVRQSELPHQEAGDTYPWVEVVGDDGRCRLRVPNGRDQAAIAGISDEAEARWTLVERCFVDGEKGWSQPRRDPVWLTAVEESFDAQAPQVAVSATTQCPECGAGNAVALDPYLVMEGAASPILEEVHALASSYHWSEREILALPSERRKFYLDLLDRQRGVAH